MIWMRGWGQGRGESYGCGEERSVGGKLVGEDGVSPRVKARLFAE
jgi:hypothetical protein